MIDKRRFCDTQLYVDNALDFEEWFGFTKKKFLSNVDTFYYSVKFGNDFRQDTCDDAVLRLRKFFKLKYTYLQEDGEVEDLYLKELGDYLVLKPVTFARFYSICLSYPDYFDIFLAPAVPKSANGGISVTSECIVQIRSYMLWQMGVRDAFSNSYAYVESIVRYFGLQVVCVRENRIDYCWHSNYLQNPEKFFTPENFYRMRVDRFKNATYVTNKVGRNDYEIDYVALGKRSDKVFVRIYQKSREVIEQGYKPWFFLVWYLNGLINQYDKYVYERCYVKKSWYYRYYARLEFYQEYGSDPVYLERVRQILAGDVAVEEDDLIRLADKLTPPLNYVINVEYQTMRRHSKSYQLLPVHNNADKGVCQRIYDYLDNRKLIMDYLTDNVFKLVQPYGDANKSRRDLCGFWQALRRTRCIDVKMDAGDRKLVRNYNRRLNAEVMKKRVVNDAVTLGIYVRGLNTDSPLQDCYEALLRLNDNDIYEARRYKSKKLRMLNRDELSEVFESSEVRPYCLLDTETGTLYDYDTINQYDWQGGK